MIYLQSHTDFRVGDVGNWAISSVADGQWHHFAIVSESGVGTTLYLDGVSQGSRGNTRTSLDLADGVIYFGQEQDALGSRLDRTQTADGILDEMRFWSVARSETEIADNLNATIPVDSIGLTAYYKLDETSGRTVADATANGLDATAVTLSPNSSTQVYGFDVEAGQEVLIDLLSQLGFVYTPNLQLVDEFGNRLLHEADGELGPVTLDAGRYYILVEGEPNDYFANGRYDLEVSVISDPAVANDAEDLDLGEVVQGEFLKRFQTDRFTFTLSEQSTMAFDSLTDSATLTWSIVQDGVTLIDNRRFDLSDANDRDDTAFVLSAGDYELQVFSTLRETYAFQLIDLQLAETVNFDESQTGVAIPADQTRAFQFNALDSETIFIDFANPSPNSNLAVKLFDSAGKLLFQNDRITDMDSIAIEQSGTHYLLLEGWLGNPETTVDFTVTKTQTTNSAIALDQEIVGTIARPGDRFEYTFELTDAEKLYFDSLTAESGVVWSLARDGINVVE